jgi:hypothetical protein
VPDDNGYLDVVDDAASFEGFELEDEERLSHALPSGTWRDNTANKSCTRRLNTLNGNIGASLQLENFQAQIRALEERNATNPAQVEADRIKQYQSAQRRKANARSKTAAKLSSTAHAEEKASFMYEVGRKLLIAEKKAHKQGLELDYRDIEGVRGTSAAGGLFKDTRIEVERRVVEAVEAKKVPEGWEDDVDGDEEMKMKME